MLMSALGALVHGRLAVPRVPLAVPIYLHVVVDRCTSVQCHANHEITLTVSVSVNVNLISMRS